MYVKRQQLGMIFIFFSQLGIHNAYIRQKILVSLERDLDAPASQVLDTTPSAPMPTDVPSAPSAPIETYQSNECVICMENKVRYNKRIYHVKVGLICKPFYK